LAVFFPERDAVKRWVEYGSDEYEYEYEYFVYEYEYEYEY